MVKLTLTFVGGTSKDYFLPNAYNVERFLSEFAKVLPKNVLCHARCDLLSIAGYVKGEK